MTATSWVCLPHGTVLCKHMALHVGPCSKAGTRGYWLQRERVCGSVYSQGKSASTDVGITLSLSAWL